MLVGAFVAAFKISNWISFYYNLIPISVYMGVCLMAPSKWQLILSAILSTFYALVMMAVIVGTSLQLGEVRFLCFHIFFSICTILTTEGSCLMRLLTQEKIRISQSSH